MRKFIVLLSLGVLVYAQSNFEKAVKKFLFHNSNYAVSLNLYEKSCYDDKVAAACNIAGIILGSMGDQNRADELYKKACDMGDMDACKTVGDMHNEGFGGFKVDYAKARELYDKSCNAQISSACMMLAYHYNGGIGGLKEDYKKAAELYEKACNMDNLQGCLTIAIVYKDGSEEIKRDMKKAAEFYGKACDLGYDEGCVQFRRLSKN
ncbi:tetratricopeptide repeat protein [Campylobacter sp. RM15925]|uniref:tetratricopeptide repeat protein n=1 Tax=Campylobacter sp. RM15925 TaxID=1705724 RepID=UPI0014726C21|nr:tetratricopeptide repeat protein [Campylobacter sp. RM15925]